MSEKKKKFRHGIADELRHAVESKGLTGLFIAAKSGLPQTTVSRFLRGGDISIHRAAKIAAILGLGLTKRRSR